MPEFGLTLPDHDLTPQEFKELARRLGRAAFVPLFLKFYERIVTGEATIEEQRKALADIGRWTGIEEEKKIDPNANLPMFNIIFGAPAAGHASIEAVEIVTEVQPAVELPTLDAEELQILEGVQHARFQASPPADAAQPDAAPAEPASGPANPPGEPAGPEPSPAQELPRPRERSGKRGLRLSAMPEALPAREPPAGLQLQAPDAAPAQALNPFEESLDALDKALGL
jgi:hypothetical protein